MSTEEYGAQTCLIGYDNLDLIDLDFSLFDDIELDSPVYTTEFTNFSNLTQQSETLSIDSPIIKQTSLTQIDFTPFQAQIDTLNRLDFDLLDFNLIQTGLNSGQTPSKDTSFMDLLNSPSAEITYCNVNSIEPNTEDDMSMMSSPASSVSEDQLLDKPKIRRTRIRQIDKKESNKMAAIRYRNKKLKEKDHLFTECEEFGQKLKDMRQKVNDTQAEISFIKSLLVEALVLKTGLMK